MLKKKTAALVSSVYEGQAFSIQFYIRQSGDTLARDWLETLPVSAQQKFAALFKRIILTHGFKKKGDKTPRGEIEMAEKLKMEFESRMK